MSLSHDCPLPTRVGYLLLEPVTVNSFSILLGSPNEVRFTVYHFLFCQLILPLVLITSKKLGWANRRIVRTKVTTISELTSTDFRDIINNQVSSVIATVSRITFHQISLACERFRSHIWTAVNYAIYTSSNPTNQGIVHPPKLFSLAHYNDICNMVYLSDDFGCSLLHVMDNGPNPPQVS